MGRNLYHETKQASENCRYIPRWIPCFRMIIRNRQAQSCIDTKSAIWCRHINARWFKWKVSWKYYFPMIISTFVWSVFWSLNHIMPETNRIYIKLLMIKVVFFFNKISHHSKKLAGTGSAKTYGTGSIFRCR